MNEPVLKLEVVAPDLLQAVEPMGTRTVRWHALVEGDDFSLVDVGLPGSVCRWLDSGQAPTGTLKQVILTHADADHIGDGHALQGRYAGAEFLAHPLDRAWIENHDQLTSERYDHARAKYGYGYEPELLTALREACGPDFSITREVHEGERLKISGRDWEVLHLPGHSRGHIGLWNTAEAILLAGDCVLGDGPPDASGRPSMPPTHQFIPDYLKTIEHLRALPVRLALTAHWPPMDEAAFKDFLDVSESVVRRDLETLRSAQSNGVREFDKLLHLLNESHSSWPESEYPHYFYALAGYLDYLEVNP